MPDAIPSQGLVDDFTLGWRRALAAWAPAVRVTSALLKLTNAGERPTTAQRLAEVVGSPVDEATSLAIQVNPRARVRDGQVRLDMATRPGRGSRFELRLGDRVIYATGCAPDQYWIALLIDEPLEIRATCQATRAPIRLIVSRSGVAQAEPDTTVIALIDPLSVQSVDDIAAFDQEICVNQAFFVSPAAGARWAEAHPAGRLLPVHAFFEFWRRELALVAGDILELPPEDAIPDQPAVSRWG